MRNIAKVLVVTCLAISGLVLNACSSGGAAVEQNNVAATVNGRNIMLSEVERVVTQQAGGNTSTLNQLQIAQARLTVLSTLIQREVLFYFDAHLVDFDDLMVRLKRYKEDERKALERWSEDCRMRPPPDWPRNAAQEDDALSLPDPYEETQGG